MFKRHKTFKHIQIFFHIFKYLKKENGNNQILINSTQ